MACVAHYLSCLHIRYDASVADSMHGRYASLLNNSFHKVLIVDANIQKPVKMVVNIYLCLNKSNLY